MVASTRANTRLNDLRREKKRRRKNYAKYCCEVLPIVLPARDRQIYLWKNRHLGGTPQVIVKTSKWRRRSKSPMAEMHDRPVGDENIKATPQKTDSAPKLVLGVSKGGENSKLPLRDSTNFLAMPALEEGSPLPPAVLPRECGVPPRVDCGSPRDDDFPSIDVEMANAASPRGVYMQCVTPRSSSRDDSFGLGLLTPYLSSSTNVRGYFQFRGELIPWAGFIPQPVAPMLRESATSLMAQ